MKQKISESLDIPEGISCHYEHHVLKCSKGAEALSRHLDLPNIIIKLDSSKIMFDAESGNKNELKKIRSSIAHIKNMFLGLTEKYVYKLQACTVHFPFTLKIEGNKLLINNFLGEKKPRYATIAPHSHVNIKATNAPSQPFDIEVTSHDKDAAGQTAANIETATKVRNRDRRIFQDGIYIVEKPGRME